MENQHDINNKTINNGNTMVRLVSSVMSLCTNISLQTKDRFCRCLNAQCERVQGFKFFHFPHNTKLVFLRNFYCDMGLTPASTNALKSVCVRELAAMLNARSSIVKFVIRENVESLKNFLPDHQSISQAFSARLS